MVLESLTVPLGSPSPLGMSECVFLCVHVLYVYVCVWFIYVCMSCLLTETKLYRFILCVCACVCGVCRGRESYMTVAEVSFSDNRTEIKCEAHNTVEDEPMIGDASLSLTLRGKQCVCVCVCMCVCRCMWQCHGNSMLLWFVCATLVSRQCEVCSLWRLAGDSCV